MGSFEISKQRKKDFFRNLLFYAAGATDAVAIGCDKSDNLAVDTFCRNSIHFGATLRSSSGRFIVNAATTGSFLTSIIRCKFVPTPLIARHRTSFHMAAFAIALLSKRLK